MERERNPKVTIDILSLFPEYFSGPFDHSMIKRAKDAGLIDIRLTDIRDFAKGRHKQVDDRPYGGGPGMVMMAEPVVDAVRSVKSEKSHVVYLSPQGRTLTAEKCRELSTHSHLIFLCGHYEGVDQRALQLEVDEEISIGDYVLTNGCLASIVVIDALLRFIPGFLGNEEASRQDSFSEGILDCPHYTRPEVYEGMEVPKVLLSGNHQQIAKWRKQQAVKKTSAARPDLLKNKGVETHE
jgi:tRNA (guanine37-N1)-methyltransferase